MLLSLAKCGLPAGAFLAISIVSLLAFAGCELGSGAITAVTGQPDPNVLYAEYERNYDAYHLDWVDYQLALEQAQGEAAAAGRETALLAQELEQAAQALNINRVPIPGDTAGRISLAGLTLAKIKKADGIPEKSDELPSEGALGYIAEYGFAAIDAAAVGLIGAAVIGSDYIGVPRHFASVIVLAAAQVVKRSLEWISRNCNIGTKWLIISRVSMRSWRRKAPSCARRPRGWKRCRRR